MLNGDIRLDRFRVIGWPRSGTHHIADWFRIYYGMNWSSDEITRYYAQDYREDDIFGVYIYRDPRDIIVSRFIQMYFRFEDNYQEIIDGRTLHQTFREWFKDGKDPHVVPYGTTWREFIYGWEDYLPSQYGLVTTSHEMFLQNRRDVFRLLLRSLGAAYIDEGRLNAVYTAILRTKRHPYSFRLRYWEGEEENVKAGVPGEWRYLMDEETAIELHKYCGEWMYDKGYISSDDWWDYAQRFCD